MFYIEINIFQDKAKINSGNKYNDNFFGLYCICKRPYPDPEDEVRDLEVSTRTVSSPAFTSQPLVIFGPLAVQQGFGDCESILDLSLLMTLT